MSDWKTHLRTDYEPDDQGRLPLWAKLIAWATVAALFVLVAVPVIVLLFKGWQNLMRWIVSL